MSVPSPFRFMFSHTRASRCGHVVGNIISSITRAHTHKHTHPSLSLSHTHTQVNIRCSAFHYFFCLSSYYNRSGDERYAQIILNYRFIGCIWYYTYYIYTSSETTCLAQWYYYHYYDDHHHNHLHGKIKYFLRNVLIFSIVRLLYSIAFVGGRCSYNIFPIDFWTLIQIVDFK